VVCASPSARTPVVPGQDGCLRQGGMGTCTVWRHQAAAATIASQKQRLWGMSVANYGAVPASVQGKPVQLPPSLAWVGHQPNSQIPVGVQIQVQFSGLLLWPPLESAPPPARARAPAMCYEQHPSEPPGCSSTWLPKWQRIREQDSLPTTDGLTSPRYTKVPSSGPSRAGDQPSR